MPHRFLHARHSVLGARGACARTRRRDSFAAQARRCLPMLYTMSRTAKKCEAVFGFYATWASITEWVPPNYYIVIETGLVRFSPSGHEQDMYGGGVGHPY